MKQLFLRLVLVSLSVCPQQVLWAQGGYEQSTSSYLRPVMLDKIKGQKLKDDEIKLVKGQMSPSPCHKLLTEELITQQGCRGAGGGCRGCSNVQEVLYSCSDDLTAPPAMLGSLAQWGRGKKAQEPTAQEGQGERQLWCSVILSIRGTHHQCWEKAH